jgi:hypothetical protein
MREDASLIWDLALVIASSWLTFMGIVVRPVIMLDRCHFAVITM